MKIIGIKDRVGRVQRQVRRCLIAHGGEPVLIADLLTYCYPQSERHPAWQYRGVRRALQRFAMRLGRMECGSGRSGIYVAKPELMRRICAT